MTLSAEALIKKISTTIDGGFDVTLSFTEFDISLVQELMRIKKDSATVAVAFDELEEKQHDEHTPQFNEDEHER